jgi:hypothetical protein
VFLVDIAEQDLATVPCERGPSLWERSWTFGSATCASAEDLVAVEDGEEGAVNR